MRNRILEFCTSGSVGGLGGRPPRPTRTISSGASRRQSETYDKPGCHLPSVILPSVICHLSFCLQPPIIAPISVCSSSRGGSSWKKIRPPQKTRQRSASPISSWVSEETSRTQRPARTMSSIQRPRWGLAGCRQLDPSHPALVTCEDAEVEPCPVPVAGTERRPRRESGILADREPLPDELGSARSSSHCPRAAGQLGGGKLGLWGGLRADLRRLDRGQCGRLGL